MLIFVSSSQL